LYLLSNLLLADKTVARRRVVGVSVLLVVGVSMVMIGTYSAAKQLAEELSGNGTPPANHTNMWRLDHFGPGFEVEG
jgi:hypothetical protein